MQHGSACGRSEASCFRAVESARWARVGAGGPRFRYVEHVKTDAQGYDLAILRGMGPHLVSPDSTPSTTNIPSLPQPTEPPFVTSTAPLPPHPSAPQRIHSQVVYIVAHPRRQACLCARFAAAGAPGQLSKSKNAVAAGS